MLVGLQMENDLSCSEHPGIYIDMYFKYDDLTHLLPLSDVCTVEVIQSLGEPLLVNHSTTAAFLLLSELPEALVLTLADSKETGKQQKQEKYGSSVKDKVTHLKCHVDHRKEEQPRTCDRISCGHMTSHCVALWTHKTLEIWALFFKYMNFSQFLPLFFSEYDKYFFYIKRYVIQNSQTRLAQIVCIFVCLLFNVKSALPCLARLEWPTNNCTNIHQQGR